METFVDVVQRHAAQRPDQPACTFLPDGETVARSLTFAELASHARALAAVLNAHGAAGQPVLVLCPAGIDYVVALIACFHAGAIAVPGYPPTRVSLARTLPRVLAIQEDCRADVALVTQAVRDVLRALPETQQSLASLRLITVDEPRGLPASNADLPAVRADMPALLQYTSGSTARPKGALLTHAQALANLEMIRASSRMTSADSFFSWLPPYHDMGLIGGILAPLYLGVHAVLMPPDAFIRRPRRWFTGTQRFGSSILIAPNFAFDLCVQRVSPEERRGLDLSSWRVAYNGAEPIDAGTLDAFADAFAPCGLRREALYPCYGLAEATLIISGGNPDAAPVIRAYDADQLEQDRAVRALPTPSGQSPQFARSRRLVGCGKPLLDERVSIVDPHELRVLPEGRVGEIWIQSRSVASGYFGQPDATAATFGAYTSDTREGPFLRTGDLGFFDEGELFLTGRLKDLIIVRGVNHYPQDIERSVQAVHPALVSGAGAAFTVASERGEQLVIVQEVDKRTGVDAEELLSPIAQAIREQHDLAPAAIALIKRGSLLKTSSGKVQRRAIREAFLGDALQLVVGWRAPLALTQPEELPDPPPAAASSASETLTRRVAREREQAIADWLRARLASRLGIDASAIDPNEPLARYGVDSVLAAELTDELESWIGRSLPATISYDNPTIAALARALADPAAEQDARAPRRAPEASERRAARDDDPIAIVGMACRFPGARDLASFWSLLRNGVDAISEVPPERWDIAALYDPAPGTPGKMCSRFGGFVEDIDAFDASFFGVSAREAARMDPQQRLFLEVAWHALEDAGQAPAALAGTDTGVFAGVCTSDYAMLYGGDLQLIDRDYGTGAAVSIVANRVSYALDLKGPSETVDSACSSALVAVQHACRSLRNRECEVAVAGGVNAVLAPESNVYFSQLHALAPDGRCKAFDERADGLVRSEGAGVVVLKRLSRALADRDRVYALVAGSSVNHDGRSNGLMAPHGNAQREVVRRALRAAEITPADVDYVEAHGVGLPVADAVELHALGDVMQDRPRDRPLQVGSAKTNVGHLEAASGMVGLIKVALALKHEEIPPHLHLHDVHPNIAIDSLPLVIPTVPVAWRRGERPRFAGVSAFGFGGTNAHVIVREAPLPSPGRNAADRPRHLLALSARSANALRARAQQLVTHLATARDVSPADVCFTANAGRSHFTHRLALVCSDVAAIRQTLSAWLAGAADETVHAAELEQAARLPVGFAFVPAPIRPGTAHALFEAHPHFRLTIELCSRVLRPHLERPLVELLYGPPSAASVALLERPGHAGAALVALQWALHELWRAAGIQPSAVYGAGAGEYAAAAAAGVFSWEQALVLAARRGLLHESLRPGAEQQLSARQLKAELAAVECSVPALPFVSASLGRAFAPGELPDAAHWSAQLYHVPKSDDDGAALRSTGCRVQLEVGPAAPAGGPAQPIRLRSLSAPSGDDWQQWLDTLAVLYTHGADVDWPAVDEPFARQKVSLPTYPFERERYWLDFPDRTLEPSSPAVIERPSSHPLFASVRVHVPPRSGFVRKRGADTSDEGTG
jgi:acyl transferase domain-containing protein/acyl-CoA synthetase (AMP-forming)/AMP-acid ligase II/acyl carrier protein